MLQQVLVGSRNLPSADLEVNFLWETEKALPSSAAFLSTQQPPSGVAWGREPAPPGGRGLEAGGREGGWGARKLWCPPPPPTELPRCLSGFANFSSLAEVMEGSEFVSFLEEKRASFVGCTLVFSPAFHFLSFGKPINK